MYAGERFTLALDTVFGHKRYGTELAGIYDVSVQYISQLKKSKKSNDVMRKIAKDKGISLSWLEFGEGEMFIPSDNAGMIQSGSHNNQVSGTNNTIAPAKMVISGYREEPEEEEVITLAYYPEVYASAGGGAMVYESLADTQPMKLSKAFVQDFLGISTEKNLHILNVKGDSMEPTILDGELIFVAPLNGDGIVDGNIYVMMYENEIYVKRIRREAFTGTYSLSSDNPAVGDIKLTKEQSGSCQIIGDVVGQMRRRG